MHSEDHERTEHLSIDDLAHLECAEQWVKDATERAKAYSDHPSDKLAVEAVTEMWNAESHLKMLRDSLKSTTEPSSAA